MPSQRIYWLIILIIAGLKLLVHLYTNTTYGIHRDGLLYLALGQHPAWGYWSNPPLIGWLGWLAQELGGGTLWVIRLFPTLGGCGIVVLAGLMARELGGGRYAQFLAVLAAAASPAYLRTSLLFMPVVFDILGWAILFYLLLRYLNTKQRSYLFAFGAAIGVFFLNKYMVIFLLVALVPALLLTRYRGLLAKRDTWLAAGLALLIISPNLIWQYINNFPVISHMRELSETQLVNVEASSFLKDQLVMHFTSLFVWIPGLWFLWKSRDGKYRVLLYLVLGVLALLLALKGKHYYTLGLYPVLMAAGSVFWEKTVENRWLRPIIPIAMVGLLLPLAPLALPMFPPKQMSEYCIWAREKLHFDVITRWEDGRHHSLPQDFADMLGWPEIGAAAIKAYEQLPSGTPVLIYSENYGLAGAVDYYGRAAGLPPVVSFSDTYRLWVPETTEAETLIYINDEIGEDVQELFTDIQAIGSIRDTFAREYGNTVYLCRQPRRSFAQFWQERVREVQGR